MYADIYLQKAEVPCWQSLVLARSLSFCEVLLSNIDETMSMASIDM